MREQDTVTGSGVKLSRVPTFSLFRFFWHKQVEKASFPVRAGLFQEHFKKTALRRTETALEPFFSGIGRYVGIGLFLNRLPERLWEFGEGLGLLLVRASARLVRMLLEKMQCRDVAVFY